MTSSDTEKLTVTVTTKPLIAERAKAAGLSMGDYLSHTSRCPRGGQTKDASRGHSTYSAMAWRE